MSKTFIWSNGTEDSPITLNTEQISTLIAAGNDSSIDTSVEGYIKVESVPKYLSWALQELYPNLNVEGTVIKDTYTIKAPSTTLYEGNSMVFTVDSSTGMTAKDLQYQITFSDIVIDSASEGMISEDTIKSRISIKDGVLQIAPAKENATWAAQITIKACPLYEDIDESEGSVVENIRCLAIALTGITIQMIDSISVNASTEIFYIPSPSNSTKPEAATFSYSSSGGQVIGNTFYSPETPSTVKITVVCKIGSATISDSKDIAVKNSTHSTITIWNGGVDGGISDTKSMVTGDVVADPSTCAVTDMPDNVIWWIRKNTHAYVCKYINRETGMYIKQLSDNDRNLYSDGTSAENAINGSVHTDSTGKDYIYDVMLRLPTFYYKCVTNTKNSNAVDVIFSTGNDDANSYYEWDTNKLIGVYEGVIYRDGVPLNPTSSTSYASGDVMYSISGVTPTANYSQASFKRAARARNIVPVGTVATDGFQIVDYETHVIMALLYYGYYGGYNINCQEVIGYGTSSYPKVAGYYTDKLGMNDTFSKNMGGTDDSGSINFWGLENWWGDLYEWVDNLITATNTGIVRINNWQGNPVRYLQVPTDYLSKDQCISKMIFNEASLKVDSSGNSTGEYTNYPDLLFKELSGSTDYTKYYADAGDVSAVSGYVAGRGNYGSDAKGGVGRLNIYYTSSTANGYSVSRLVFCGTVTDVTGTAEADSF
jgi:hypothetical protein